MKKMAITDTLKEKVTELLPKRFQRKESYNSNTASTGSERYKYKRLAERSDRILYQTVRNLMKDPQVKMSWAILKYYLISKNYTLTSNSDDPNDIEVTEFVQECLDNMSIPFRETLKNVLSAIIYGFSVQEVVYTVNKDMRIVFDAFYPVHIKTLQNEPFVTDKYGELKAVHQESDHGNVDIPISKIMLYSYDKEFDELEGTSILRPVKIVSEDKENVMDWLMTFLDRLGSPVLYGKTDDGVGANAMLDSFDSVANGTTGLTVGLEDEIGVIDVSSNGEAYFKTLQYKDNQISRCFFIGNVIMGDNMQTGSYAQSQTQENVLMSIMNGILSDSAQCYQLKINELVKYNFGVDAKAPNISFENFTKKDTINLINAINNLITSGSFDSSNMAFRELLAKAFMDEADIKLDINNMDNNQETNNNPNDNNVNYDYQPPLPGTPNPEDIVNETLKGII